MSTKLNANFTPSAHPRLVPSSTRGGANAVRAVIARLDQSWRGAATAGVGLAGVVVWYLLFERIGHGDEALVWAVYVLFALAAGVVGYLLCSPGGVLTWPLIAAAVATLVYPNETDRFFYAHYGWWAIALWIALAALLPTIVGFIGADAGETRTD